MKVVGPPLKVVATVPLMEQTNVNQEGDHIDRFTECDREVGIDREVCGAVGREGAGNRRSGIRSIIVEDRSVTLASTTAAPVTLVTLTKKVSSAR